VEKLSAEVHQRSVVGQDVMHRRRWRSWQGGCYQYVVDFSLPWRTLQAGESAA
jgi:hypothetical protein